ncbi:MAG TPA: site-2 protease family protein [Chitinophagaceae bacterium]|nr:site-2 protease family protein [Chitinophagaceae bacterium]
MENYLSPDNPLIPEEKPLAEDTPIIPPKPPAEEPKSRANIWLRSISSLALYLAIGYYFFNQNWTLVLVLTGVVVFHELGHFFAMKMYNYTDLGIFFIPLVGAYASGKKHEVSQLQSSVILLAGPVPGIILGILLQLTSSYFTDDFEHLYLLHRISWILIYLNLLNLLPIYPLDGGQLLNRLFLDSSQIISKIFLLLSIGALVWFALDGGPRPFYALLIIPFFLLSRLITDTHLDKLTKKVEAEGINLDTSYEDISDENYWKIRNILIRNHASLKDVAEAPPYEYSHKEQHIRNLMQSILQRTIVQDISVAGKIIIILVWTGCFAAPFLIGMPLSFF